MAKRNNAYWERRKAQDMFGYMEKAEQAADEISSLYLKASRYLSGESDAIFNKFKGKHSLSENEAYRLLNQLQGKTSIDSLKEALRADKGDRTKAEILAELESPAYRARLERLQQLQNQLDITMQQVYGQEKARNTSHYVDLANEAYYKSIFNVQQQAGLGFGFNYIDPMLIDRVINSKWSGENYSSRIWNNTQGLAQDLKEELLLNLVTGRTNREVADIIANKFAQGASNARRLVRTESCNLANQIDMESYGECGIETYIYVATLDLRTSSVCRKLDGKRFKVSEQQPGVNCPPMHPWCRSTTICDISDEELSQMKRRARDPVTGKTQTVPANMTYEEWHDKNVRGKPETELQEKKIRNLSADRKQFEKYRKILGDDAPKTLDSFQEMKYNNIDKWGGLKKEYRIVNQYESNHGSLEPSKITDLDKKAFEIKRNQFSSEFKKGGNIGIMELDGEIKFAHSAATKETDKAYKNFKGNKDNLILMKSDEDRIFKTKVIGTHDRKVDSESKLLEYAAGIAKDGKKHTVSLLSERCMCDSCTGVLEQFLEKFPNVEVRAYSGKYEKVERNKNNPWGKR